MTSLSLWQPLINGQQQHQLNCTNKDNTPLRRFIRYRSPSFGTSSKNVWFSEFFHGHTQQYLNLTKNNKPAGMHFCHIIALTIIFIIYSLTNSARLLRIPQNLKRLPILLLLYLRTPQRSRNVRLNWCLPPSRVDPEVQGLKVIIDCPRRQWHGDVPPREPREQGAQRNSAGVTDLTQPSTGDQIDENTTISVNDVFKYFRSYYHFFK